jgi:hypothetical protein
VAPDLDTAFEGRSRFAREMADDNETTAEKVDRQSGPDDSCAPFVAAIVRHGFGLTVAFALAWLHAGIVV